VSFKVLLHPKAASFVEKLDRSPKEGIRQSLRELESSTEAKGDRLKYSQFWRLA